MRVSSLFALTVLTNALAQAGGAAPTPPDAPLPVLLSLPGKDVMSGHYPPQAARLGLKGQVKLRCRVKVDGSSECRALEETPPGLGFSAAAEQISSDFRFKPALAKGAPVEADWYTVLNFTDPARPTDGPKASDDKPPRLASRPTAEDIAKFYPPLAHLYEIGGQAIITCGIRPDGTSHDCKARGETPPGLGFGHAAEKVAATFHFSAGTMNGLAVEQSWTSRISFQPDAEAEADPAPTTPAASGEALKLAEQFVVSDDLLATFDAAAASAAAKRDCTANGGGACEQFAKAVEDAVTEENATLRASMIAWVASTYTDDELKALVFTPGARNSGLIEKGGALALAFPKLEHRAARDHHRLIAKHYCAVIGCPPLILGSAPAQGSGKR